MDWYILIMHTVLMYVIVFIVMRLMGKREIGKLSVIDLVVSFMIAEIAVIEIEQMDNNFVHGLIPIGTLLLIQVGTAYISLKSRKLRVFMDGKPTIIIANGKIDADQLKKHRYTLDDLMLQLREQGYTDFNEVDFAILETNGKLNVIAKEEISETDKVTNQDETDETTQATASSGLNRTIKEEVRAIIPPGFRYETLPIPLIMDGHVQDSNLEAIKQTRFWLKKIVKDNGGQSFKDVLLCTIDHKNRIYIDLASKR